ncbi:MAG TPA: PhnD/SsuA/transferrin family substrate-binding protein [Burkholderiaceae bacterium]|nr:PhnD/SsuA/transferrin family substrate-binding protein [Burkholderiaceae bacterium]
MKSNQMTRITKALFATTFLSATVTAHATLVFGVTEGVTYRASDAEIEAKFAPIAKLIGTATKQPVKIQIISSYNGLRDALKQGQLDIAFIHPAHVSFEAIKTGTYKSVAWTTGFTDYKVSFLCKEEPIKNWASISGKALVTPDADSITAIMTRSMLRENKLNPASDVKVQVTRFQDAVPFYVDNNFASYGATASGAVIKAWKDKGGKTCAQSRGMPIKHWLVSSKMDAGLASTIKDTLLNIDKSEAGKKALATSGYKGFSVSDEAVEKTLTNWLGL